ncbi:MAG: hypothetical protein N2578_08405, partial [Bdellovibrionaceae bacterium]|nr:hypothetical protein [Pseudobdellovibrionaceae bacterium]
MRNFAALRPGRASHFISSLSFGVLGHQVLSFSSRTYFAENHDSVGLSASVRNAPTKFYGRGRYTSVDTPEDFSEIATDLDVFYDLALPANFVLRMGGGASQRDFVSYKSNGLVAGEVAQSAESLWIPHGELQLIHEELDFPQSPRQGHSVR